jgi:hypothetical protein
MQAARKLDLITAVADGEERILTLLELVAAVAEEAETDAEILAAVTDLINTGRVRLIGSFLGADVQVR